MNFLDPSQERVRRAALATWLLLTPLVVSPFLMEARATAQAAQVAATPVILERIDGARAYLLLTDYNRANILASMLPVKTKGTKLTVTAAAAQLSSGVPEGSTRARLQKLAKGRAYLDAPGGKLDILPVMLPGATVGVSYDLKVALATPPPVIALSVTGTVPSSGASQVDGASAISATFSTAVDPATLSSSTFQVRDAAESLVVGSVSYDATRHTATFQPASPLAPQTAYTVRIVGGSTAPCVKGASGQTLASDHSWSFVTAPAPAPGKLQSLWENGGDPQPVRDPHAVELGVRFQSDVAGYIHGIRFHKGAGNTGTHRGTLWSTSGAQLATATFTSETSSGWQEVRFSRPVAINAKTPYVASYFAPEGNYSSTGGYFRGKAFSNPPLTALREVNSKGNGLYRYGGGFPTGSFNATNYWVDVLFSTSPTVEPELPTVKAPAAPSSLSAAGKWESPSALIQLEWAASTGAESYTVYRDGSQLRTGVTSLSLKDMPLSSGETHTYTVTAVGPGGESAHSPAASATAPQPPPPAAPETLRAQGLWVDNCCEGHPMAHIELQWPAVSGATSYVVYRDNTRYKTGLTEAGFKDMPVPSGETHTYRVCAVGPGGDGPLSPSATATAPFPPQVNELRVLGILPNDDSAQVTVMPFPGATDYRIYPVEHGHAKKYSGGNTTVEWNGIPATGVQVVVEAVDRLGPFQYMDDRTPHSEMHSINGHGPADAQPLVLAQSQPFWLFPQRHPLRDTSLFFDDGVDDVFRPVPFPQWGLVSASTFEYIAYESNRYLALLYGCDVNRSRVFNHDRHLMTVVADGPTHVPGGFTANNYAAMVLLPKAQPAMGDNVLHFSFEVDAHLSGRRWIEVVAFEAGTPLLRPNTSLNPIPSHPTGSGQYLTWLVNSNGHHLMVDVPAGAEGKVTESWAFDPAVEEWTNPLARRQHWALSLRGTDDQNGLQSSLDLRKRFDLYISRNEFEIHEGGRLIKHGTFTVPLRFNRVQFGLTHMVYHSELEHRELLAEKEKLLGLSLSRLVEDYWLQRTPYHDERHWDNLAISSLGSFPR